MPNPKRIPNHGPGRNTGLTTDQEQRACYSILKRFQELPDQNQICEALNVWPDATYQAYLNGS